MVDSQRTFVKKFADYASDKHPNLKIQSMNHGIDGYNTIQVSELLASRVLQFEPNKVVYVMCLNDFDFEGAPGDKIRYFKRPPSFIWDRIERFYMRHANTDWHLWKFEKNKREVFDKIVEMKHLLHAHDIDFQVVVIPVFKFKGSDKNFTAYPLWEMHFAIGKFLAKNQIDFMDLLESFRNQDKPPEYFGYDSWHPTEEGHDIIAKELLQFVLKGSKL